MNRRTILQLTGAAFATGTEVGSTIHGQEARTNEEEDGGPETVVCEPDLRFGERKLIVDESGVSPIAYGGVVVENVGSVASGGITLTAVWRDESGNFINDDSVRLPSLGADETWLAYIRAVTDAEPIDGFDVSGEFEVGSPRTPPGLTVVESDFDYSENKITGVVENTREEDIDRVEAYGKLYDEDGYLLGGASTWERGFPAGRNWKFEIRTPLLPASVEPTTHDVTLNADAFRIRE